MASACIEEEGEEEVLQWAAGLACATDPAVQTTLLARSSSLWQAVSDWMDVEARQKRDIAMALVRLLEIGPRLFLFPADGPKEEAEARDLVDITSKVSPGGLAILLLRRPGLNGIPDLARAGPTLDRARYTWEDYVTERVAWHTFGCVSHARTFGATLSGLTREDDAGLERALDRDAAARWDGQDSDPLTAEPWRTRAILRANPGHPRRSLLLSTLVCRTLTAWLLERCLLWEAHARDVLRPMLAETFQSEDAEAAFARLQDPKAMEARVIPPGSPLPTHAEDLAGLATYLHHSNAPPELYRAGQELRMLRNLLAHGSPAGWGAVLALKGLERRLRTLNVRR